jgi:WD40 repeat protein
MVADTTPDAIASSPSARVFISYSRNDAAFADRLEVALKARGFEPLIDRRDIAKFENWWQRIEALIVQADTVVFVISPDAVKSTICQQEVAFAQSLNKRLAPIVWRQADAGLVPDSLGRLNWIDFQDDARFDDHADELAAALQTDIEWIRKHTEFGQYARRWSVAGRPGPRGLLLRSPALEEAERWIASRPHGAPEPTDLHQDFIRTSRREAIARRRYWVGGLSFLVIAGLALRAIQLRATSAREAEVFLSQARAMFETGYCDQALRLAIAGLPPLKGASWLNVRSRELEDALSRYASSNKCPFRAVLAGHQGMVSGAAFSPDGSRVVTASSDKTARLWDAKTAALLATLPGHKEAFWSVVFSPDGTYIATASSSMIPGSAVSRFWDGKTGAPLATLEGEYIDSRYNVFNPDGGRIVTGSSDGAARIWTIEGRSQTAADQHGEFRVTNPTVLREFSLSGAAFSSDGNRVVTGSQAQHATIWDARTGASQATLPVPGSMVNSAMFSHDGSQVVTAASDPAVRLWDAKTGTVLAKLSGDVSSVDSVAFNQQGNRVISTSTNNTVRVWDAQNHQQIKVLRFKGQALTVVLNPDGGSFVTTGNSFFSSGDDTAPLWSTETGDLLETLVGHGGFVTSAAFNRDGSRIVTTSADKTARLWDIRAGSPIATLRHNNSVVVAAFSPDGAQVITGAFEGTARLWDSATGRLVREFPQKFGRVTSVAFSPDGNRVVVATNLTTTVWDARSGAALVELGDNAGTEKAVLSPDGSRIATVIGYTVRIWDARTGAPLVTFSSPGDLIESLRIYPSIESLAFNPSGDLIITAGNNNIPRLWDAKTGAVIRTFPGSERASNSAAFSPDGSSLITVTGDGTHIWAIKTGALRATISGYHGGAGDSAAFNQDGSRVVDTDGRVWDTRTGAHVATLSGRQQGFRSALWSAEFSPDGSRIVTASDDKTAQIWDAETGSLLATLAGHEDRVMQAAFSPDGRRVVSISEDTARVWQLDPAVLMKPGERAGYVCRERLIGAQGFTNADMQDPTLRERDDLRNPCDRVGPLDREYYRRWFSQLSNSLRTTVSDHLSH